MSSQFVGSYVSEYKEALKASALSGVNCIALSKPGYGKTQIARRVAAHITGDPSAVVFIPIEPSTAPEAVIGAYDPAALLNGQLSRITAGTPYDPSAKIVILDEIGRANDVLFDALLHPLERDDPSAPVIWSTSNFAPKGERTAALQDRIGLWIWINPGPVDASAVAEAHLSNLGGLDVGDHLPDWSAVQAIRTATPGKSAIATIKNLISTLAQEALKSGFAINPRRVAQWSRLLYRCAAFETGSADFSAMPDKVTKLLRYAYPCETEDEAVRWSQVAGSVVDVVGSAIEGALTQALTIFRQVSAIQDPGERTGKLGEMGKVLASTQQTIKQLGGTDPRVNESIQTLTEWFSLAVQGKPLQA